MSNDNAALTFRRCPEPGRARALRLLTSGTSDDIAAFERRAATLNYPLSRLCIAERGNDLVASLLPLEVAGVLQLAVSSDVSPQALAGMLDLAEREVPHARFSQVLLAEEDVSLADAFRAAGFVDLALLLFLRRPMTVAFAPAPVPAGYRTLAYSADTHSLFLAALDETYAATLDCPRLNGLRTSAEALAGHKLSGQFDPTLWQVVLEGESPAAVLLLNPDAAAQSLELAYVGVAPAFRRRGLAQWAVRHALREAFVRKVAELSLVVDRGNSPALSLYYRHGFRRSRARRALVKPRAEIVASAPHST